MAKLTVTWNQRSYPMSETYRQIWNGQQVSASFNNEEGTITWLQAGKYGYNCAMTVNSNNYKTSITKPCVIYLAYDLYTTISGSWSFEYAGQLPSTPITVSPNTWTRVAFIYTVTGSGTGNERELIPNLRNSTAQVGDTAIIKNNILVNLTQMYGAGNEPTSVQEFEAQCALNGIDLSTYHSVNVTGTQRVWYTEEKMYETASSTAASVRDIKSQSITKTTFSILPKKYIGNDAISGTNITAIDGYTGCEINEAEEVHFLMPKEGTSWNDNGIYVEYTGNGFYRAHASAATNGGYSEYIEINQPFTITSVANGGQLWLNNNNKSGSAELYLYNTNKEIIDYWSISSTNRKITSDGSMAGKTLRYIRIKALSNSFDVVLRPLFLKNHYSTTTIDWSSIAGTVYVGHLYPINGELMSSGKMYTFDGSEDWRLRSVGSVTDKWPYYYLNIDGPIQTGWCVCSHAPYNTRISISNQMIGCNVANLTSIGLFIYIRPDSNDVVWNDVEAFKAWLATQYQNGTPMKVVVRTNAPASYTITPISSTTKKGKNCFWSNMNGGSSAMYPIYDSHDIIVARNKVALNEPHIEQFTENSSFFTYTSDMYAPLKDYKLYFDAKQIGCGYPTPNNIRTISGFTGLDIYHGSTNIIPNDIQYYDEHFISSAGIVDTSTDYKCVLKYIKVKPGTTYTVSVDVANGDDVCLTLPQYSKNKTFISRGSVISRKFGVTGGTYTGTFTTTLNTQFIRFSVIRENTNVGIFENTVSNAEATNVYHVSWQTEAGTLYGGYYDFSTRILTKTHELYTLNGTESWSSVGDSWNSTHNSGVEIGFCLNYAPIKNTGTIIEKCNMLRPVLDDQVSSIADSIFNSTPSWANLRVHTKQSMTVANFKAMLVTTNLQLVVKLATPVTYQLSDSIALKLMRGRNTFWVPDSIKSEMSIWTHTANNPICHEIDGLSVAVDNGYYSNNNGNANGIESNNNYFITGVYDTGSANTKHCTLNKILAVDANVSSGLPAMRVFDKQCLNSNLSDYQENPTSTDFWTLGTTSSNLPTVGEVNITGRYFMVPVYKPTAADFFIFNNTNQKYICHGKNLIDMEIPSEYKSVEYLSRTSDYAGPYCNIDFEIKSGYTILIYVKQASATSTERAFAGTFSSDYDGNPSAARLEFYYNTDNSIKAWSGVGVISTNSYLSSRTDIDAQYVIMGNYQYNLKRLGAYRTDGYYKFAGNLYGMALKDEIGRLIHNLVPVVRISDSEPGFFDRCTGIFYSNDAPTGQWVAGPNIT